jgi:hypothetical protein
MGEFRVSFPHWVDESPHHQNHQHGRNQGGKNKAEVVTERYWVARGIFVFEFISYQIGTSGIWFDGF